MKSMNLRLNLMKWACVVLALAAVACDDDKKKTLPGGETTEGERTRTFFSNDYASGWKYFSFKKGNFIETPAKPNESLDWDVAFNRYYVKTNSGTSGKGTHPAGKYEKTIAKNIKRAAGQHTQRGKAGIAVVSQRCRQHLIQQKQREHPLNRAHVFPSQRQQRFIRAEESQNRPLKAQESRPCQQGQNRRTNDCRCEILVLAAVLLFTAALRAENNAAADAHQQAQTVDDIPDRRNNRQRRRSLRAVILPHHRRIHNGIHRGNHGAAKRRGQVAKIHEFDFSVQQIHAFSLLFTQKSRTNNRRFRLRLVRPIVSLNDSPSDEHLVF